MNVFRRTIGTLRRSDDGLRRDLRRIMSRAVLAYCLIAFLLLLLFVLASAAPHPLSLFLGDLLLVLPLLFRIVTMLFLVLLALLIVLRIAIALRLRRTAG
jgi:hypothetical protein